MIDPDAWSALVLLSCPAIALALELTAPGTRAWRWLARAFGDEG